MYIALKVGIVTLAAGLGVGVPFSLWALQRHGEPRVRVASVEAPAVTDPPSNEGTPVAPPAPSPRATARAPRPVETMPAEVEMSVGEPLPAPADATVEAAAAPPPPAPSPIAEVPQQASPVACGTTTCPWDQECCNASCGICVARGGTCTNKTCGQVEIPYSAACGLSTCNVGQVCCNASCGICAAPDAPCSQEPCG